MRLDRISLEEWKKLYDAAIGFKKLKCWDWMWDSDLFGVQHPESGEIGYCCIMGRGGEHFALAVYQGPEGLEGFLRIQSGEVEPPSYDLLHLQKCLMVSFEDREFLENEDLRIIKELGLTFRGKNAWPLFRNYRPGYYPWFLTLSEVDYLTMVIPQAIDVALRFKDDPELLTPLIADQYLVRVPKREKDGLRWYDDWKQAVPLPEVGVEDVPLDDLRLEKIQRAVRRRSGIWEVDFFYSPYPVREKKERPYYPRMMLCVDHNSGLIMFFHLAASSEYRSEFMEEFLQSIERYNLLPREIAVKNEEAYNLLNEVAPNLGITIKMVKNLPALEEAQSHMTEFARIA